MELRIRLFAVLRERAGADEVLLEGLPEALDVAAVKAALIERHPELGDLSSVAGVIGDSYVPDDTPVRVGDAVAFLPPVSGGAPDDGDDYERGVFELSSEPLDPGELGARVGHPSCGAIVVFTGTTREKNRDQTVVRLDYEAFEEMAGTEMERIFRDCLELHAGQPGSETDGLRMLCAHRTGTVGVGEPSVVIAVASPHRDASFRAARFLIDTLKERLPVWKKEVYEDGHHWIGDRS